jgi:hypothetical protein
VLDYGEVEHGTGNGEVADADDDLLDVIGVSKHLYAVA